MNGERIKCPACGENVPGAWRFDGFIAVLARRGGFSVRDGSLRCPCGAVLTVRDGCVVSWGDPAQRPVQTNTWEANTDGTE